MTDFASDADAGIIPEPKAPPKSARRRAREFTLQGLYQWRVGGADEAAIEAHMPELEGFAKADREFFVGTLRGVIAQNEKLAEQIGAHIDRPFAELSPIEACVLLMGSFELVHHAETPYRSSSTSASSWPKPLVAPMATNTSMACSTRWRRWSARSLLSAKRAANGR